MRYLIFLFFIAGCSSDSNDTYHPRQIVFTGDAVVMMDKINQNRAASGLNQLIPEERLTDIAIEYSKYMNDTGVISHDGFYDRQARSMCYSFGECLSYNYDVYSSFDAYLMSKSHNQTLVNPRYTHIGYGRTGRYECVLLGGYDVYKRTEDIDTLTVKFKI